MKFDTQKEIWDYLISGGCVTSHSMDKFCYHKLVGGFLRRVNLESGSDMGQSQVFFSHPPEWKPYVEPKWHETLPKHGAFCWVGDTQDIVDRKENVRIVLRKDERHFHTNKASWLYAKLLTPEEIKSFTFNQ